MNDREQTTDYYNLRKITINKTFTNPFTKTVIESEIFDPNIHY